MFYNLIKTVDRAGGVIIICIIISILMEAIIILYSILFMEGPNYLVFIGCVIFLALFLSLVFFISLFVPLSVELSTMWNLLMSVYFNAFDINSELKMLNMLQMQKSMNDGISCNKFFILNKIFIMKKILLCIM
ncbi:uncharacterized protein LOC111622708 [Centruroides sculpturatus]|uniref:uncharacterized protein LOC111622708 n=1 Tax=Centruroides sculpturatus TaxID=218467 RepID=UPI000C6CC8F0|nr:uncharacterized protein LOC111622708 [Centruroides sculpturatus]